MTTLNHDPEAEAMPKAAYFIAFGPEIRSFVMSGLMDAQAQMGEVLVIAPAEGCGQLAAEGIAAVPAPAVAEPVLLRRLRALNARVAEIALAEAGHRKWRHALPAGAPRASLRRRFSDLAFRSSSLRAAFFWFKRRIEAFLPASTEWTTFFRRHGIGVLIYSAYCNARTNAAAYAARRMGIRTIVVPNSWKDFYVQPVIDPVPDEVWVWDEEMKASFLAQNRWILPECVHVKGALQLQTLRDRKGRYSRERFAAVFGLDPVRPVICYTSAAENAVRHEELVVRGLAKDLLALPEARRPQLLVRTNPMESGTRFQDALAGMPGVVVWRPHWEWLVEADWCCPYEDDVELWAAALEHMDVNVSVPSTVTVEALAFGRPVINIGFDGGEGLTAEQSCLRFWQSPYYQRFHADPCVRLAASPAECLRLLAEVNCGH